jgi:carbamoyltransferase
VVRRDRVADYFELNEDSPYMLLVAPVQSSLCQPMSPGKSGFDLLKTGRSTIPAVTHVDYSARVQTVTRRVNPRLYDLLLRFEQTTGCGVLINTSFNVRGEPIVCTPDDAYRSFMNTEMDYLIIGNFVIERLAQSLTAVKRRIAPQAD